MTSGIGRRLALLGGVAVLALAGCGDDADDGGSGGGGDDAAALEAVVSRALSTQDPAVKCEQVVTPAFVRAVYGDVATCRKAETPEPDDKPAEGASVSDVQVDGGKATATVRVRGGESDGATGPITFAKVEDAWKVDELSVAFLRSQLAKGLENGDFGADDGPLADDAARACIAKGLQDLDDAAFRQLAYDAIADKDPTDDFLEVITRCASQSTGSGEAGDVSLLRRQFESGIRESLEGDKATKAQIDCVVAELRKSISDKEIADQVKAGDKASKALTNKAVDAIQKCG